MSEELGNAMGMGVNIGGSIDVFITVLIWTLVVGSLAAVGFIVWFFKQFKIRAEVTEIASNGRTVYYDKVREVNDKNGDTGWKFLKTKGTARKKKQIPKPENEYVDLISNGQKFCRFVKNGDVIKPWHPVFSRDKLADTNVMTRDERIATVDELERANKDYTKTNGWDVINRAIPIVAVLIIFVGSIVFFGEIGDILQEITEKSSSVLAEVGESNERIAEAMEELTGDNETTGEEDREVPI